MPRITNTIIGPLLRTKIAHTRARYKGIPRCMARERAHTRPNNITVLLLRKYRRIENELKRKSNVFRHKTPAFRRTGEVN